MGVSPLALVHAHIRTPGRTAPSHSAHRRTRAAAVYADATSCATAHATTRGFALARMCVLAGLFALSLVAEPSAHAVSAVRPLTALLPSLLLFAWCGFVRHDAHFHALLPGVTPATGRHQYDWEMLGICHDV